MDDHDGWERRFGMLIHHTDADREYAYDRTMNSAALTRRWMRRR